MNRNQLYNEIISLKLQDEVKAKYGKNYTRCTNVALQEIIDEAHKKIEESLQEQDFSLTRRLIDILAKKKILLKSEIEKIIKG